MNGNRSRFPKELRRERCIIVEDPKDMKNFSKLDITKEDEIFIKEFEQMTTIPSDFLEREDALTLHGRIALDFGVMVDDGSQVGWYYPKEKIRQELGIIDGWGFRN